MASAKKKKDEKKFLQYKGKPLVRKGTQIYYGNHDDKYIISMLVKSSTRIIDLDVSTRIEVKLQTNEAPGKEKVIKKAEREGIYSALDLGEFWLQEALAEDGDSQ
ncbi:MAG: hypothetical protein PHF89_03710 [Eubacteriales bacterium]|jgi:hypothetical protein|nr:hypothetical protein [Eubacteriales bacterium]